MIFEKLLITLRFGYRGFFLTRIAIFSLSPGPTGGRVEAYQFWLNCAR